MTEMDTLEILVESLENMSAVERVEKSPGYKRSELRELYADFADEDTHLLTLVGDSHVGDFSYDFRATVESTFGDSFQEHKVRLPLRNHDSTVLYFPGPNAAVLLDYFG